MSKGREHDERRKSQAAAARRHRNRKGFYKGDRLRDTQELHERFANQDKTNEGALIELMEELDNS